MERIGDDAVLGVAGRDDRIEPGWRQRGGRSDPVIARVAEEGEGRGKDKP